MKILAIETSCDDTAIALVEASGTTSAPKFKVLKSIISSQIEIHRPWGGVVPNLAKREHIQNLPKVFRQIFNNQFPIPNFQINPKNKIKNKKNVEKIDAICVTVGPGLEPALWAGITFAKEIYKKLKTENPTKTGLSQRLMSPGFKPWAGKLKLIGVNHLEGHLYSFLLSQKTVNSKSKILNPKPHTLPPKADPPRAETPMFPAIALIVSGGHTILLKMDSLIKWKKLGETKDDAVGESFDKVAKMLGFPYPGGPEIQRLAEKGDPNAIRFPRPMIGSKDYNFSYSGLKTSVLYYLRDNNYQYKSAKNPYKSTFVANVAASFQEAALDVLVKKTERAAREYGAKSIFLSGGVAANKVLRNKLSAMSNGLGANFFAPPMDFNTDNAVMIAVAGYMSILRKKNRKFVANGNMGI